ncbi:MAG: hypothetical protein ABR976_13045 [Terracidiphilus sp.]|jgi:hypothetical protein
MTDQQADPPETFRESAEKFSRFLAENGHPSRIRWITAYQILLGDNRQHFIRASGAEEALEVAQLRYNTGLNRGLGILLQAICVTKDETIASVYTPTDKTDAEYRRIRPCLKLSCPTELTPATVVVDQVEWQQLETNTRTRSKMLHDTYDL